MGINPLDPGSTAGRPDRDVNRGHGTRALGPSDSSDTGADLAGLEPAREDGADIDVDHIEAAPEGLDDEDKDDEG
jgi:hypothetical protein